MDLPLLAVFTKLIASDADAALVFGLARSELVRAMQRPAFTSGPVAIVLDAGLSSHSGARA